MSSDYGYANARIRALKSVLLSGEDYDRLIAATSADALIEALLRTAYKPDVEAALVRYHGVRCLTDAVRRNVTRTVGSLRRFFDARARELIELLLARWDLFNVIAILRGQSRGVATDEILSVLVPAGMLTEAELCELAKQPTMQATGELMLTWRLPFAGAVAEALRSSGGELAHVERRLHQIRFREAFSRLRSEPNDGMVREMLVAEVDGLNLSLLVRLRPLRSHAMAGLVRSGADDVQAMLIAGGSLPLHLLLEIATTTDVDAMVGRLAGTPYGLALRQGLDDYEQRGEVAAFERALEKFLVRKGIHMFRRDPLTIAMAIGYLWAKTTEVANLRLIAQGKELGWQSDAIRNELTLV
ncbi:MAG TPA: V-type ATPase subunit [Candidatus Acidoferrales bacterium]|nr:V-type ATPase subunit [Candidatus Acidoferrales bacterium]